VVFFLGSGFLEVSGHAAGPAGRSVLIWIQQVSGQQPCQGGDHGPVGPVRLRAGDLAAQDRDPMPQHQDFHILQGVVAGEQRQPAEQAGHRQVEETEEHECRG
jgi:hypothetical protein